MSADVRTALEWFIQSVLSGPLGALDGACSESNPDEAWSGTSVGAVLANNEGQVIRYFGHVVDEKLVKTWGSESQVQHVFEAEVLPYALCLMVWGDILRSKCVFAFIDNEAAKASWISGFAHSMVARTVIHHGTVLKAQLDIHPFFSPVPTFSNFGDEPSTET